MLPSLAQLATSCAARSAAIQLVNKFIPQGVRGQMQIDVLNVLIRNECGMSAREIADELGVESRQRIDDALFRLLGKEVVSRKRYKRDVPNFGLVKIWIYFSERGE